MLVAYTRRNWRETAVGFCGRCTVYNYRTCYSARGDKDREKVMLISNWEYEYEWSWELVIRSYSQLKYFILKTLVEGWNKITRVVDQNKGFPGDSFLGCARESMQHVDDQHVMQSRRTQHYANEYKILKLLKPKSFPLFFWHTYIQIDSIFKKQFVLSCLILVHYSSLYFVFVFNNFDLMNNFIY